MITSDTEREAREAGINPHLFAPRPIKIESPPSNKVTLDIMKASADSGWGGDDWGGDEWGGDEWGGNMANDPPDNNNQQQAEVQEQPPKVNEKVPALEQNIDSEPKLVIIKSEKMESTSKKYNLRPKYHSKCMTHRSKKVKYQANLPKWVPRVAENCFRDSILTEINIQTYHLRAHDEFVDKIINLTSISKRSQLDSFVYSSKKFVAICWLTTLRIFEYMLDKNMYLEVKRIPDRYIPLSPQLLTSVHCDSNLKIYLAYLWGAQGDEADSEKPYIEIRDLYGKLVIERPFYYDHVVQEIYSDDSYIYARLSSNIIYVHRKNYFKRMYYRIDFNDEHITPHIDQPIISSWVANSNFESYTKLIILSAGSNKLFITRFILSNHRLMNSHHFTQRSDFKIISIDHYKNDFIIHRNTPCVKTSPAGEYLSEVDIGSISYENYSFEPHINLTFHYFILQVRLYKDNIYLFGFRETQDRVKFFEIGCLSIKDLNPKTKWTTYLNGVDTNTQILIHSDNIAIIKSNQQVSSISTASRERHECRCCKLGFLKKEDKIAHETNSTPSMFTFKFGMNKIQVPPKKITRRFLDHADSNQNKTEAMPVND